ncbi:hypothetical protein BDZ89DRAFT_1173479 [Hymenopellis radicata]|nr:hypothetical protein BDZ89DRAFT_1173479 [Hymenopellis radicata]
MAPSMSLDFLLNDNDTPSEPPLVDISALIRRLYVQLDMNDGKLLAPPDLERRLREYALSQGTTTGTRRVSAPTILPSVPAEPSAPQFPVPPPPPPSPRPSTVPPTPAPTYSSSPHTLILDPQPSRVQDNIRITKKTRLHKLYTFEDPNTYIEYPETHPDGIGYLIRQDASNWRSFENDFEYSRGAPKGQTKPDDYAEVEIWKRGDTKIPCKEHHSTCQGVKICPSADADTMKTPHLRATRESLAQRLKQDADNRMEIASLTADVFNRTVFFLLALHRVGCRATEESEAGGHSPAQEFILRHRDYLHRGYTDKIPRCSGEIRFIRGEHKNNFIQCEHYDGTDDRNHFQYKIDDETFDAKYMEAVLEGDIEEAKAIESAAEALGYGPAVECTTVANANSQRLNCPHGHRDSDDQLCQPVMIKLPCKVTFRVYEPFPEYQSEFPYTLIVVRGTHYHPVPLPQKTPPLIRGHIMEILNSMGNDIADMTVRRFLQNPLVHSYIREVLPDHPSPILSDVHVSLANRSHLRAYIKQVKVLKFPHGTGWAGAIHMFQEEQKLPPEDRYLRRVIDLDASTLPVHPEDNKRTKATDRSPNLKAIVCMLPEASRRLLKAQYLQSDISFKRIVEYREFVVCGLDRVSNTIIVYSRVYMNRDSAEAHHLVLEAIEGIVFEDTGERIPWRHLYAVNIYETDGLVLLWTGDQHGGQAKGLGLHLWKIAQSLVGRFDLHEPERLLASLSVYEHLHRIFRLCRVHFQRNIHDSTVDEDVKKAMLSLACIHNPKWDEKIQFIKRKGGKKGTDWVANKTNSHFAFEAICQSKSKIPMEIWCAGDKNSNYVEVSHFQVNLTGVRRTLVGGIHGGYHYDTYRMGNLKSWETAGIRPSYATGSTFENSVNAIHKKSRQQVRQNTAGDEKILQHNSKVEEAVRKANTVYLRGMKQHELLTFLVGKNESAQMIELAAMI